MIKEQVAVGKTYYIRLSNRPVARTSYHEIEGAWVNVHFDWYGDIVGYEIVVDG